VILSETNDAVSLSRSVRNRADLHFTVLDFSDGVDFACHPVLFIERNRTPRAKVAIGRFTTILPVDWFILIGDREHGTADLVTVREAIERRIDAIVLNPWRDRLASFAPITMHGSAREFISPKMPKRNLLVLPLSRSPHPPCVFVARDATYFNEPIEVADLIS
jgi:hypothetical protein